jgi:hypothetical protein
VRRITLDLFVGPGGWSHAPTFTGRTPPGLPHRTHLISGIHADERP